MSITNKLDGAKVDDHDLIHKVVTGFIAAFGGVLAYVWRSHADKVKCVEHKVHTFPLTYITKDDCERIHTNTAKTADDLSKKIDDGFQRVFEKIDLVQRDVHDKHDKLRDLIDERTRRV